MNWWLYILPVISCFVGWLITWVTIKLFLLPYLLKRQPQFALQAGKQVSELFSFADIEEKLTNTETLEKIMPEAEKHVDHFLRAKLKDAFPVVGMFIGDKTITQLKEIFLKELGIIFPVLMKNYVGHLQQDLDLASLVSDKINTLSPGKITSLIKNSFSQELRYLQLFGALTGLLVGIIQLLLLCIIIQ